MGIVAGREVSDGDFESGGGGFVDAGGCEGELGISWTVKEKRAGHGWSRGRRTDPPAVSVMHFGLQPLALAHEDCS